MVHEGNHIEGLVRSRPLTAVVLVVGAALRLAAAEEAKLGEPVAQASPAEQDRASRDKGLTVLCVDKDGRPVAGAEVHLFQCVVGEPSRFKHFGPFTSDEQGSVTRVRAVVYDGRDHFDRWAYARVPGRLVGVARSTNWKNRSPTNAEFRVELQPSRSVDGVVTVPQGFDPSEVIVRTQVLHIKTGKGDFDYQSFPRHLPFEGLDSALADVFEKRPDAQGRIHFDDVPVHGSLYLVTVGEGLGEAQWRNSDNAFDEPIRLAVSKEGVLAGRVVSPQGQPAVGMTVSAQLSFTRQKQLFHLSTFRAETDGNGRFAIHGLPETPFVLSVGDPTHQWVARPHEGLQVVSGESKDVEVSMEVGIAVSGRVFDPNRNPVEGAALSALADTEGGPGLADDTTDREGRYRLRLPAGRARLYFNSLPEGFAYPDPQIIKRLDLKAGQDAIEGLDLIIYRKANDEAMMRAVRLRQIETGGRHADAVAFTRDGALMVTAGWDFDPGVDQKVAWTDGNATGVLQLWDVAGGKIRSQFERSAGAFFEVAISPDDKLIATAGRAHNDAKMGEVKLWDIQTGRERARLGGHTGWVMSVAFSPDGQRLASGGFDCVPRIWDVTNVKLIAELPKHDGGVQVVEFSPDGATLATAAGKGVVALWDTQAWKQTKAFSKQEYALFDMAFSPDGRWLAVAGGEGHADQRGLVVLKNLAADDPVVEIPPSPPPYITTSLAFSPDSRLLATLSMGKVKVFTVADQTEIAAISLPNNSSLDKISFLPAGRMIVVNDHMGAVTFWTLKD